MHTTFRVRRIWQSVVSERATGISIYKIIQIHPCRVWLGLVAVAGRDVFMKLPFGELCNARVLYGTHAVNRPSQCERKKNDKDRQQAHDRIGTIVATIVRVSVAGNVRTWAIEIGRNPIFR